METSERQITRLELLAGKTIARAFLNRHKERLTILFTDGTFFHVMSINMLILDWEVDDDETMLALGMLTQEDIERRE